MDSNRVRGSRFRPAWSVVLGVVALALGRACSIDERPVTSNSPLGPDIGDAGGTAGGGDAGDSVSACIPGTACIPANPCHEGALECAEGLPAGCRDTGNPKADGNACDENAFCRAGSCEPCLAGESCALEGQPCRSGSIMCAGGASSCAATDNQPNGSPCGDFSVCQAGACGACVAGGECTPADPCHVGALDCSLPLAACMDTGASVPPGTSCGADSVCSPLGQCVPCVAGGFCTLSDNACRTGTLACNTGEPVCIESGNAPNGSPCGDGLICNGGACVPCAEGLDCQPNNPCHEGSLRCGAGTSCEDTGEPLPNGTSCGEDKVCSSGTCTPCAADKPCEIAVACRVGATSCTSGVSACVEAGNAPDGEPCGEGHVCAGGECIECTSGTSCVPSNPCHAGALDCSSGTPQCEDMGTALPNGTSCGQDLVCRGGQCVSCREDQPCQPANVCKTGTSSCDTGSFVCVESGNRPPGDECGDGLVCNGSGGCVQCADGDDCTPENPCHTGELSCSTGAPTCVDTGTSLDDGRECGDDLVCSDGRCVACTADLDCPVPGNACRTGRTSCTTGSSVCQDVGNKAAGAPCGADQVCNGSGRCVACDEGAPCTPSNRCHQGRIACASGAPVCVDTGQPAADGTECGNDLFCRSGTCSPCEEDEQCQPNNPCKRGATSCATGLSTCVESGNQPSGTSCGPPQSCSGGRRTAAALCNSSGQCPAPSVANCANGCNAAGTDCLSCQSGQVACNGVCCAAGQGCCGGVCVNLNTTANCGSCGTTCGSGRTCSGGACKLTDGQSGCGTGNDCASGTCNTFYRDADGDLEGNPAVTTSICTLGAPTGFVPLASDCDDSDSSVFPGYTRCHPTNFNARQVCLQNGTFRTETCTGGGCADGTCVGPVGIAGVVGCGDFTCGTNQGCSFGSTPANPGGTPPGCGLDRGASVYTCDGPNDCGAGQVCCASFNCGLSGRHECFDGACPPSSVCETISQMCNPLAPVCPPGQICRFTSSVPPTWQCSIPL